MYTQPKLSTNAGREAEEDGGEGKTGVPHSLTHSPGSAREVLAALGGGAGGDSSSPV